MSKRERIMDLVKNGVISADEAIVLLEKLDENKDYVASDDDKNFEQWEKEDEDRDRKNQELDAQFEREDAERDRENQKLDEQFESEEAERIQRNRDREEKRSGRNSRVHVYRSFDDISDEDRAQLKNDWSEFSNDAANFGKQMGLFGRKIGKVIRDSFKDNNFGDMTSSSLFGSGTKFTYTYDFREQDLDVINFKNQSGNLNVLPAEGNQVHIDVRGKVLGNLDKDAAQYFADNTTAQIEDGNFTFEVKSRKIIADVDIFLPKKVYNYANFQLKNGDIDVQDFASEDMFFKLTNGDQDYTNISGTSLEIEGLNGDIAISDKDLHKLNVHTVNGDVDVKTAATDFVVSLVNGDIVSRLSSEQINSGKIELTNGDIRVAVPETFNSKIIATKSTTNSVTDRLSNFDKDMQSGKIVLEPKDKEKQAGQLNVKVVSGSIFIKDDK